MVPGSPIDTAFDVCAEARGADPDAHSPTLRRYHQLLWGKPVPGGASFDLDDELHHASALGEFWLSSDAITNTYLSWTRPAQIAAIVEQVPEEEVAAFYEIGCTIGAYLVFPFPVKVHGVWQRSVNQERGTKREIRDRFDLTLECIRRHYRGEASPLKTLALHSDFFGLFGDFRGYVDHFLLNDLLDEETGAIRFYLPFDNFDRDALPASVEEYIQNMQRSMDFVSARNRRIARYAATHLDR